MRPKSILLVSDFAYPVHAGTERLVFGLAKWFNLEYSINVDILTPNWNSLKEEETVEGVTIYRFKTHDIYHPNPTRRIFDFIKTGLKLGRYDIYHGFYMLPPLISAIGLAKLRKSKSVITFFGREQLEKNLTNPIRKYAIIKTLNTADSITTYTWLLEKYMKNNYFKNISITTLQGWAESKFVDAGIQKNSDEKVILFVGRMTEEKGIFVLLESFAKIKETVNAKLVLIGPPYEQGKVEETVRKLNIEDYVDLLGFVSEEELNEWYNKCDVVAVPALHTDGFGLSLMEAVACGKPVISTEGVGSPEGAEDNDLIVKPHDVKALSNLLSRLLTDQKFYDDCKKSAVDKAKLFVKRDVMDKYLQVYEKVMEF